MLRIIVFYVLPIVLCIFCLVQAITSRDGDIRNLPKVAWILLILFFPVVGSIAWLVAGQPQAARPRSGERSTPHFPEYDRPGRAAAVDEGNDDAFLRQVRERAEQQRRDYEAKRRAEQAAEEAAREERRRRKEAKEAGQEPGDESGSEAESA
ncbi:hypothetical protein GCM10007231_12070 [Nocardioides daphniae]|uniref:PLDc_N domain-containing protein n=2 Tax=Nocardioides daphniae TaxID=402297 RepID=A0A4P7UH68_9ACTN|nr:PLDc_N domain-containing protein [Nocardioides daphniae]GGD14670.1 hypothetical protein GCM10007231_12070 [Nocardioides daphniae]